MACEPKQGVYIEIGRPVVYMVALMIFSVMLAMFGFAGGYNLGIKMAPVETVVVTETQTQTQE